MFYKSTFYKSTFYKSTFYKSTFYKSTFYKSTFLQIHLLQIHLLQIHSTPLHVLQYAYSSNCCATWRQKCGNVVLTDNNLTRKAWNELKTGSKTSVH